MNVIVDTSVWSLALRRRSGPPHPYIAELAELIRDGRATMLGPIRQELLCGIRERADYERLRDHLREFPDAPLRTADYERAAEHFNRCRSRGIQGSNTDFLICAIAERDGLPVFTSDQDFRAFTRVLPVQLYEFPRRR
jgi:predicted nucleic acid-binding protein